MSMPVFHLYGSHSHSCGYCAEEPGKRSEEKGSISFGLEPLSANLSCSLYMHMLDRGWRRSGTYLYKPEMKRTCCPQYTIKLDAMEFAPTRSQRQITNRWNRYILEGSKEEKGMEVERTKSQLSGKSVPAFELIQAVHAAEAAFLPADAPAPAHKFEIVLEPASYTEEKFRLYQRYQKDIHKEQEAKEPHNFKNFLVQTPLVEEPIPYPNDCPNHLPKSYGSYHQCYRLDEELIAVAVLDILPGCVSSVYFMYDKKWEKHSLGKLSALREVALAREIRQAGIEVMHSLYMGFYVHTCPKMRYKGDYSPSYLLDPEDYTWFPFRKCAELLDKHRYVCFARPETFFDEDPGPEPLNDLPQEDIEDILIYEPLERAVMPVTESPSWKVATKRARLVQAITGLSVDVARCVVLVAGY